MATNIKLMRGANVSMTNPAVADGQLLFDTQNKSIWIDVGTTRYKLYDQLDTAITDIGSLKALVGTESVAKQIKDKIDELKASSITEVESTNTVTLTLEDGTDSKKLKADVKLSSKADNALKNGTGTNGEEGLYVAPTTIPEYSIVKAESADDGYAATYYLAKDGTQVGTVKINIEKDKFVQSVTLENSNGQGTSGKFIKIVFANDDSSTIYLDVKDLFNVYESGSELTDMVVIAVDDEKISASITDGTITKAKLHVDVQTSLGKADTAVQPTQLVLSATEGKYVAGITYDAGTFSLVEKDLPDISALQWNDFVGA